MPTKPLYVPGSQAAHSCVVLSQCVPIRHLQEPSAVAEDEAVPVEEPVCVAVEEEDPELEELAVGVAEPEPVGDPDAEKVPVGEFEAVDDTELLCVPLAVPDSDATAELELDDVPVTEAVPVAEADEVGVPVGERLRGLLAELLAEELDDGVDEGDAVEEGDTEREEVPLPVLEADSDDKAVRDAEDAEVPELDAVGDAVLHTASRMGPHGNVSPHAQGVQVEQADAPLVAAKVPAAQAVHTPPVDAPV